MFTLNSYYAGKIYLQCSEKIERTERHKKIVDDGKYELFYDDTNVAGVINYGCIQLEDGIYHRKGYVWSSRPGCVNKEWGTKYIEAVIDHCCYAIDADVASSILEEWLLINKGEGYKVAPKFVSEDNEDIVYTLEVTLFGEHVSMEGLFR